MRRARGDCAGRRHGSRLPRLELRSGRAVDPAIGGQGDDADTAWLWTRIPAHYRGAPAVAGYDLLNEPTSPCGIPARQAVWIAYDRLYRAGRTADPDHMISLDDTFDSWSLDMLGPRIPWLAQRGL